MNALPDQLIPVFSELEGRTDAFAEYDVASAIWSCCEALKTNGGEIPPAATWERMAFDFEEYPEDEAQSGHYFGELMASKNGTPWPNPASVNSEMLNYWMGRSREAKHPLLRARYADLVWDMVPGVAGAKRNIESAQIAIDSYCDLINQKLCQLPSDAIAKAERAMNLALSVQDSVRVARVRDVVLKLDIGERDYPYGAGTAFEFLLINHKNVPLEVAQRETLIHNQETILEEAVEYAEKVNNDQPNLPIRAQHAGVRLARYYRSLNQQEQVRRVLALYARAYISSAKHLPAMIGASWLGEAYQLLTGFGCTSEAESVAVALREASAESTSQMVQFHDKIEISRSEVDAWTNSLLADSIDESFNRIVWEFIPDPNKIEAQLKEIAEKAPLSSMFGITQVDADGRPVAHIGSMQADRDGRVYQHMGQNLQFEAPFLRHLLITLLARHNLKSESVANEVFKSSLFRADRKSVIQRGIEACLAGDHVIAAHLLIPQLEQALRNLAIASGSSVYKPDRRRGGIQYKVLDDLLREDAVVRALSERVTRYFRIVLTDPRGWNLRNDLMHGILGPDQLSSATSDRLLHVMLTLSRVRASTGGQSTSETPPQT